MTNAAENSNLFSEKALKPQKMLISMADLSEQEPEAVDYWTKCLDIIRDNVSSQVFRTWFEPIKAYRIIENNLTVIVPSQFFCEWIEEHYYLLLQRTIQQIIGDKASLQYQVVVDDHIDTLENRTIRINAFKYRTKPVTQEPSFMQNAPLVNEYPTYLNPRYSFDNFLRGESNQLASSAAMAIAKNPGTTRFNPFVVYGDTGLGKTHLVQAIGNQIQLDSPKTRVLYTTSERFTLEFINSIQNNRTNEFYSFYRSIDVLIVDDIQFFGGKEKTQDHFFHTFNALHQSGKQIILSSDKPPRELKDVDERLISRFQWGLTADIQPPSYEMRCALIQKKSSDEGLQLPMDIVEFIARNVTTNIREIEGILISLLAKITLDRRQLNLDLVKEALNRSSHATPRQIGVDYIKEIVSNYYKISILQLESKTRKHEIALARQMAIYLAKRYTTLSLKSIGSHFGGRDHSTVLHSCTMVENYLETDKKVKASFDTLIAKLA